MDKNTERPTYPPPLQLKSGLEAWFYTCIPRRQPMSLTSHLRMLDMTEIPIPEPDTRNISTNSLLLLKYCPTISVAVSLVMPTPTPRMMP